MPYPLDAMRLWKSSLGPAQDNLEPQREILRTSLDSFRERVAHLVSTVGTELPGLTVHDVTHLDALWRVADEIAGPDYPINAAEAYVLGGAILLHDAAHVVAAYPDGLAEIKNTPKWKDLIAQRYAAIEPADGSLEERSALFQVIRDLHADQAHKLPSVSWKAQDGVETFLIEDARLRQYYGDLIGEIASSHHWPASRVAATFNDRQLTAPGFLHPATWKVDALKVAFLLRTADAAHLDDQRAPWFLFALRQPKGVSLKHWNFQSKMGQPTRREDGQLLLSAGSPFSPDERDPWWLAFDTARMVDRELRDAQAYLEEGKRPQFAATSVVGVESTETFSRHVRVVGWEPVDVQPKVGDVPNLIRSLGGKALYGDDPLAALRELLQNALDAVRAARGMGYLGKTSGHVDVSISQDGPAWLLSVLDTGIGMSRRVISSVLLDFGNSLWQSDVMRDELPGLASSGFQAVGQFGIGFYSVFMLGTNVTVTSRRFEQASGDGADQWQLKFEEGVDGRPSLSKAPHVDRLKQHGTQVSVRIAAAQLGRLLRQPRLNGLEALFSRADVANADLNPVTLNKLSSQIAYLCPCSDVTINVHVNGKSKTVVNAGDWTRISPSRLLARVQSGGTGDLLLIRDERNAIIGRVGVSSDRFYYNECSVVFHGINCSRIDGLIGVIQAAANNSDAKRTYAKLGGSTASWSRWASEVLAQNTSFSTNLHLHPLVPEHDLPVFMFDRHLISLGTLENELTAMIDLTVHSGSIDHDTSDDVGSDKFRDLFKMRYDLLVAPVFGPSSFSLFHLHVNRANNSVFPWILGVEPIDYLARLNQALTRQWGTFDEEEVDEVVGEVDGTEIRRSVTFYRRTTASPE